MGERVDKKSLKLSPDELSRINNILQRAKDLQAGVLKERPSVTEDHPDGLDLSLYNDEDQLKSKTKRKRSSKKSPGRKRKSKSPKKTKEYDSSGESGVESETDLVDDELEDSDEVEDDDDDYEAEKKAKTTPAPPRRKPRGENKTPASTAKTENDSAVQSVNNTNTASV